VEELAALVPRFQAAFLDAMADWMLPGRHRQARCDTSFKNYPLPNLANRLFFLLVYLKQSTTQLLHRCVFGMERSKAIRMVLESVVHYITFVSA
jgi:hypothetical protein